PGIKVPRSTGSWRSAHARWTSGRPAPSRGPYSPTPRETSSAWYARRRRSSASPPRGGLTPGGGGWGRRRPEGWARGSRHTDTEKRNPEEFAGGGILTR